MDDTLSELPVYCTLRYRGENYTLVIDLNKYSRYQVWWEESGHLFPINFKTLLEATQFAEGWLDMVEAGGLDFRYVTLTPEEKEEMGFRSTRTWPSGKDCMGFIALVLLLATLVLLLYLFG